MPAERAGYTVTMFLVDVSPSMGKTRVVDGPDGPNGLTRTTEMTHLEWALQFVMLKVQEMIFNGRKTDKCGVVLFGTEGTDNLIHDTNGGYEHVSEYIQIAQPNAGTLAKLAALRPSDETVGDPIDALIVGVHTQDKHLDGKKTWTRKVVLLTDGDNPIEIEDWQAIVQKMSALDVKLTVVGVDFDDEEFGFVQEDKSHIKRENEAFFHKFVDALPNAVMGTLEFALQEVTRPDIKQTKSALMGTVLRLGDPDNYPNDSMEIHVKSSKCTALARPKSWKRFAKREMTEEESMDFERARDEGEDEEKTNVFAELKMRSEYVVDTNPNKADEADEDQDEDEHKDADDETHHLEKIEKEELVRGFKYGATYVPCPDGQFKRLPTKKGIEICGFFKADGFRREQAMGEVQYLWAEPTSGKDQVALSSLVQAMDKHQMYAVTKWVSREGMDPRMGVLAPCRFDKVDCFLWVQMPFADDIRKYTFPPLENLINKKAERVAKHPYIPTDEQMDAMGHFVDAMDLMQAGEKDEEGNRAPWFDTRLSYNPAIHRIKQALFHSAVAQDLSSNPLPPPHPELTKYFNPPKRALKRARDAIDDCKAAFRVKEAPKKVAKTRKDGHVRAQGSDDDALLLDRVPKLAREATQSQRAFAPATSTARATRITLKKNDVDSGSETGSDDDSAELLLGRARRQLPLPTPEPEPTPKLAPKSEPEPEPEQDAESDAETDYGREPGRIVGTLTPLRDFRRNLARGDVVSKAVEDMGWAVREVVLRPFAARRRAEVLECMAALREACLLEDEIDAWNSFLKGLREACLADPGNPSFWQEIRKQGAKMSLIGKSEAKRQGGRSDVPDDVAHDVSRF
ncbi:hypothetical protein HETIRDRAFT_41157 [Heterobasidion irregulare TC 32-1]|uniref:ATP-dependent DNA helicase II subunit 2 n=1 Tax=Heterobasidion irregulare (strain TC 32-1) TaxID=747525 RepID=W4KPL9_HETIT|nr:uncharacterized protein HETIRDRAFT_41157 [Heterobasidion irregulare TC 32-1]ETW87659.1 hypothetical protein HETIRDRAFT_41157 [Heterobasidion irregulare TC 32-1]